MIMPQLRTRKIKTGQSQTGENIVKRLRVALTSMAAMAAIVTLSGAAHADFQTGWTAYQEGNFTKALSAWRPMAEAGDARSQFNIGNMYDRGRGVAADRGLAITWWRKAADRGYARAQYNLANSLIAGDGVTRE